MIVPFEEAKSRVIAYARKTLKNHQDWHYNAFDKNVQEWTDFYHYLSKFLTSRSAMAKEFKLSQSIDLFIELGILTEEEDCALVEAVSEKNHPDTFDMWGWFEALGIVYDMQQKGLDGEDIDITNI